MNRLKLEYKASSFSVNNVVQKTPPIIKKIGNALVIVGTLSGAVALLFNPTVGAVLTVAGGIGKIISMFFGDKKTN